MLLRHTQARMTAMEISRDRCSYRYFLMLYPIELIDSCVLRRDIQRLSEESSVDDICIRTKMILIHAKNVAMTTAGLVFPDML